MPQVYITGTISAASGFDAGSLFCRWRVEHDLRSWRLVSGEPEGQTQAAEVDGEGIALWDHPIDLHLSATDVIGWPSLVLEVWRHESSTARNEQTGVALFRFPSVPGEHLREVGAWRPRGTAWEGFVAALGGPKPSLKSAEGAFTVNADRSDLTTVTAGTVIVECRIAVREMAGSGMVLQPMTGAEVKLVGDAIAGAYSAARKGGRYIDEEPDTAGAVGADEASSGPSAARGYAGSR
ncbi:hypothetical protein FNF27_04978 [Cafeteria roenbergensis]|nr:hypothetical protein FNF28_02492 [Cafeteria roenbergensis]KAA0173483.1 hypothetical protein FNF27_04978 [Cafeteria roenbergensis]